MANKDQAIQEVLDAHFLFNRLQAQEKQQIGSMFEIESYRAGDPIVSMGTPIEGMYSVYAGDIRLKGRNAEYKRVSLGVEKEGSTYGEIGLLTATDTRNRCSATQHQASCFSVMEFGFGC